MLSSSLAVSTCDAAAAAALTSLPILLLLVLPAPLTASESTLANGTLGVVVLLLLGLFVDILVAVALVFLEGTDAVADAAEERS